MPRNFWTGKWAVYLIADDVIIISPSSQYHPYLNDLRSQLFLEQKHTHRSAANERGSLNLSFVFLDPSDDFKHLELPGTTEITLTQTSGGKGVAIEQEAESEVELPPGWEERTVSYIATRKTSEAILKRHKE